jgi:hypothetical protein
MAAVSYRAGSYNSATSSTSSVTITNATGHASGDLLLLKITLDGATGTITWPSGFTQIVQYNLTNPDGATVGIAYKFDSGSEPSTYTISYTYPTTGTMVSCSAWQNVDTTSPYTLSTVSNYTGNASTPISVAITGLTAVIGDALLLIGGIDSTSGSDTWSAATIAGFTALQNQSFNWSNGFLQYKENYTAGATGTITVTSTRTAGTGTGGWYGYQLALHAAAGSGITISLTSQSLSATQSNLTASNQLALTSKIVGISQGTLTYSAGSNVNVTLTGISLNSSQSNIGYANSKTLVSQLIRAFQGSTAYSNRKAIVSQLITTNSGNITYSAGTNVNVTLSGITLGVSQGSIGLGLSKSVNGQLLSSTQSNLSYVATENVTVLLTGQSIGLSQGNILISGTDTQLTDTHDGFWAKQWIKANNREEKKRIEAIEIDIEQIDEQIVEVKKHKPVELVSTVKQDTFMQDFLAEQERLLLKLIAQKQQLIDEEDETILLLL